MVAPTKPREQRPDRVPVGGPRDILTVANKDPNYVYRWVNDSPGRLEQFQKGGYEFVEDNLKVGQPTVDKATRLGTATTMVRGTATLVLMRILREWYDEDQAAKQLALDELEDSMREGKGGEYGKVSITTRR